MTYYSIYIPSKTDCEDDNDKALVFTEIDEALKVLKTHKEARLKTFKNNQDALKFSQIGFESCPIKSSGLKSPSASAANAEKAVFRAPTKQELIQFRKAIEDDQYERVEKQIWENPRYLVNVGDTPASLKDGTRYNALHVCAIHKRPRIAELILQTISKISFIELLHGKKNEKVCQEVCEILMDYYLNMPEKGRSETPLHLAVKFGAVEIVEVLTSYPQCKMTPNLDNMLPKEIICSRVSDAKQEVKDRIANLLEERFYVPVIRSVDQSLAPTIGEPFSITNPPDLNKDPLSPEREIQAYAGPMNKEQARNFRRRWKTPPRVSSNSSISNLSHSLSPLKFPCSSTPQKKFEYNNGSPIFPRQRSDDNLFPNKSYGSEHLDDQNNENFEPRKLSPEEICLQNNNIAPEKICSVVLSTPLRRQKKDLFFTYRDRIASPLFIDGDGPKTPKLNNSAVFESNDSPLQERHLKLSDTEKGLEVIGRELAREQQIDWKEYWDFLGCFVDIASTEGLRKLETFLRERKETEERQKSKSHQQKKEESILDGLCDALNSLHFKKNTARANIPSGVRKNTENKKPINNIMGSSGNQTTTAPYLCVEKSLQVFAKRMTKTILHNLESIVSINDCFNSELKRLKSLVCSFKDDARFTGVNFNLVHSRFANLIVGYLKLTENVESSSTISKVEKCFQQIVDARKRVNAEKSLRSQNDKKEQLQCVSELIVEYIMLEDDQILPENMKTEQICRNVWEKEHECLCHWENTLTRKFSRKKRCHSVEDENWTNHVENGGDIPKHEDEIDQWENTDDSSGENSDIEEDEEIFWSDAGSVDSDHEFYTPPESPSMLEQDIENEIFENYKTYLLGDEPTKRDLDVVNALFNTEINRDQYPHIHHWRAAVLRHSLEERDNFPSPSVVVQKRRTENPNVNNNNRIVMARRLFSSPMRSYSSSQTSVSSSGSGDFSNLYHQNSGLSSIADSRFTVQSPSAASPSRANLSLAFMNVSDI